MAAQVVVAVAGFFAEEAPVAAGSADGFDVDAVVVVQVGARRRVVRVDEEGGLAQDVVLVVVRFVVDGVVGGDAGDQGDEQGGEGEAGGQAQAQGGGAHGVLASRATHQPTPRTLRMLSAPSFLRRAWMR